MGRPTKPDEIRCHDCGALEGQLHVYGCDMERCPFCLGQIITCGCVYKFLELDCRPGTRVYMEGPTEEQSNLWIAIVNKQGRIPYIRTPVLCEMCGTLWPDLFHSDDWEKFVPPTLQPKVLCTVCFERFKEIMPDGWQKLEIREEDRVEDMGFALTTLLKGNASFFCPVEHCHTGYAANGLYYQKGKLAKPPKYVKEMGPEGLTELEFSVMCGLLPIDGRDARPVQHRDSPVHYDLWARGFIEPVNIGGDIDAFRKDVWRLTAVGAALMRQGMGY